MRLSTNGTGYRRDITLCPVISWEHVLPCKISLHRALLLGADSNLVLGIV